MIVDPNVPIQVDRSPEGAVTVHIPAGSVDWAGLVKTTLPMVIKIVEQILEAKSSNGPASSASPGFATPDEFTSK